MLQDLKCHLLFFGQIANGPQVVLRLRAHVTMPDMEISDDVLEFNEVKCGECRVITVQIHNHQHVRCDWFSGQTDEEKKQVRQLRVLWPGLCQVCFGRICLAFLGFRLRPRSL